jgi:hypothetical protein
VAGPEQSSGVQEAQMRGLGAGGLRAVADFLLSAAGALFRVARGFSGSAAVALSLGNLAEINGKLRLELKRLQT